MRIWDRNASKLEMQPGSLGTTELLVGSLYVLCVQLAGNYLVGSCIIM